MISLMFVLARSTAAGSMQRPIRRPGGLSQFRKVPGLTERDAGLSDREDPVLGLAGGRAYLRRLKVRLRTPAQPVSVAEMKAAVAARRSRIATH
jgi:hypothetical protein